MKVNVLSKNHTINLAVTGLMGALVFVATYFFKIRSEEHTSELQSRI